jgi:hypothetical protein
MVIFLKKACIDCGFLGWGESRSFADGSTLGPSSREVTKLERDKAQTSFKDVSQDAYDVTDDLVGSDILGCYRLQWQHWATHEPEKKVLFDEIIKKRRCSYFVRYNASHKPEQHLQIQEKASDRSERLRNIIIGALAVAASTGLIELIRWVFSR